MSAVELNYNNKAMKHFIRSVKYFVYFSLMCAAIVTALVLIGAVEGGVDSIFEEGYRSIGKIAIFFAVVAAVYPKFGFIAKEIDSDRPWLEIRQEVIEYMRERSYILENEDGDVVTFRFKTAVGRLSKMYEDRLTLTKTENGYRLEGLRKDVMRLSMGLEYRLNPQE